MRAAEAKGTNVRRMSPSQRRLEISRIERNLCRPDANASHAISHFAEANLCARGSIVAGLGAVVNASGRLSGLACVSSEGAEVMDRSVKTRGRVPQRGRDSPLSMTSEDTASRPASGEKGRPPFFPTGGQ